MKATRQHADSAKSVALDSLRGTAAVLVLIGHVRGLFFVDYRALENPPLWVTALYAITSLGHQAVILFFVLSGYLIALGVLRDLADGTWSWSDYSVRRLSRLYAVLLPALLLGFVWDAVGLIGSPAGGVYHGGAGNQILLDYPVVERLTAGVLAGNVLFLQEILVPTFGSNSPLWSLSYEFWYYALFPCLALAVCSRSARTRAAYAACALLIMLLIGPSLASYFVVWMLGAAGALLPWPVTLRGGLLRTVKVVGAVALLAAMVVARESGPTLLPDLLVATLGAALIYLFARAPFTASGASHPLSRIAGTLASYSFSLYLLHMPVLVFASSVLLPGGNQRWLPDAPHLATASALTVAVLGYAWLVARFTEHRTATVRADMYRLAGALPPRLRAHPPGEC